MTQFKKEILTDKNIAIHCTEERLSMKSTEMTTLTKFTTQLSQELFTPHIPLQKRD